LNAEQDTNISKQQAQEQEDQINDCWSHRNRSVRSNQRLLMPLQPISPGANNI
jgi:hypothetical protein